jgi:NifB/MoaA-like Fe-S oxidoreductase
MDNSFYITNRQKLLFTVKELHKRGFGKLRIIPSLSPSGMSWRCRFIAETKENDLIASTWMGNHEKENSLEEIKLTPQELANLFIRENLEFIEDCKGENEEYVKWYGEMVDNLEKGELPYAFSDYFSPTDFWKTSKGNEIKTLPNEKEFYFKN